MKAVLLVVVSALIYFLCFPPADLGFLGFFALVPWCFMAQRFKGRRLFLAGYSAGATIWSSWSSSYPA